MRPPCRRNRVVKNREFQGTAPAFRWRLELMADGSRWYELRRGDRQGAHCASLCLGFGPSVPRRDIARSLRLLRWTLLEQYATNLAAIYNATL